MMIVASLIGLIRRHPVSHIAAKAAAPIGAVYMLLALISGAFWGAPTWGAWWDFGDARLMAALILFFFYLGYIALWNAIEEPTTAAELAAVLCLFGSVFAFLSRYVSAFARTLHQKKSMSAVNEVEKVADQIFWPSMLLILAHYLIFLTLLMDQYAHRDPRAAHAGAALGRGVNVMDVCLRRSSGRWRAGRPMSGRPTRSCFCCCSALQCAC